MAWNKIHIMVQRSCNVWDGRVIMSEPISCAYDTTSKVTWLPCPSRTSMCLLVEETPFRTNSLKKKGIPWK